MKLFRVWIILLLALMPSAFALEYYVDAVHGDDAWPGAEDTPFRTLERVVRQYRVLCQADALRGLKLRIIVNPGIYLLTDGLTLEEEDSVPVNSVVEWIAKPGAILTNAMVLSFAAFVPVTESALVSRLPEKARKHVVELDLRKAGISLNATHPTWFRHAGWTGMLFADGKPLQPARWPNDGWQKLGNGAVVECGGKGKRSRFRFSDGDRFACWKPDEGSWLHGFFSHDWYDECMRIAAVDAATREVELYAEASPYGLSKSTAHATCRMAALNVLEELDQEGEWWVSADGAKLVAWLPKHVKQITYSSSRQPLMMLRNCHGHRFYGFSFETSAGDGVVVEGNDVWLTKCSFRQLGGQAIAVCGYRNKVQQCDVSDIGLGGIAVTGGDVKTLTASLNEVAACRVQRVGQAIRTWTPAVKLSGVGHRLHHCKVRDIPQSAVIYDGCEHCIEHNDIGYACLESTETGVLYTGRHWESRGTVIRHNYFHHHGAGICLDDCDSGDTICFNVFVNVPRAVNIGGGRDNVIRNNVFVDSEPAVCMDDRGVTRLTQKAGDIWNLAEKVEAVQCHQFPWNQKYPELETILTDQPELPLHNVLESNVFVACGLAMKPELRGLLTETGNLYMATRQDLEIGSNGIWGRRTLNLIRERLPDFQPLQVPQIAPKP